MSTKLRAEHNGLPGRWRLAGALLVLSVTVAVCTATDGWAASVSALLENSLGVYDGKEWIDCSNPNLHFCASTAGYGAGGAPLGDSSDCTGSTQAATLSGFESPTMLAVSLWNMGRTPPNPSQEICSTPQEPWPGPYSCSALCGAIDPASNSCTLVTLTAYGWGNN